MTIAVDLGHKATKQANKQTNLILKFLPCDPSKVHYCIKPDSISIQRVKLCLIGQCAIQVVKLCLIVLYRYEQKEAEAVADKLASLDSLGKKDEENLKIEEKVEPKVEEIVKKEEPGMFMTRNFLFYWELEILV